MPLRETTPAAVSPPPLPFLPAAPVERWMRPLVRFLKIESTSGLFLLACTALALVLANLPWAQEFDHFWHTMVGLRLGPWTAELSLHHLINDGLMTIFFFVAGLEIKRELVAGELRDPRKAALPVMAALGGMLVPAGIYFALQRGQPGEPGWGIPMATDIAFVVGFLALLGPRAPLGLKILLLSLAIADDLGAVLVIAVFYSTNVSLPLLALAAVGFLLCFLFNRVGVRAVPIYLVLGSAIWLLFLHSGVHPTVAGVLLGLLTPASAWVGDRTLRDVLQQTLARLEFERNDEVEHHAKPTLKRLSRAAYESVSPLERLETWLHPWVAYMIMPLFALANAGVAVELAALTHGVSLAVALGLAVGKPVGIFLFSFVAVQIGLARLPQGVNWRSLFGAGCLAGIGFTMSLFIASLALPPGLLSAGKIGTLLGSAASALVGLAILGLSKSRQL